MACEKRVATLNLVAGESDRHRQALTALSREHPDRVMREVKPFLDRPALLSSNGKSGRRSNNGPIPRGHALKRRDINPAALRKILHSTFERQATEFEQLLGEPAATAQALRSLSLMAELIYSAPASRRDPAQYSFNSGSRDGYPYRAHRPLYDAQIDWLREAIARSMVAPSDKAKALKALASFAARL